MSSSEAKHRDTFAFASSFTVVVYGGVIASCFFGHHGPCVFWTMVMPMVPVIVVLGGFHAWRRVCPLARIARLGSWLAPRSRRRSLRLLDPWVMPLSLFVLGVALALRLLATNGDPCGLACMLAALAVLAIAVNAAFGGRAWCNYVCPVGVVERIYTDGGHLRPPSSSRCSPCVGCKRACPDIAADRAYDRDLLGAGRRVATYAFPGLVLAFYGYFRLRHGDWAAYFDGEWTRTPLDAELVFGPGFAFAPGVPAVVAAPLTLAVGMLASFIAFALLEHALRRRVADRRTRRHVVLSFAAFCAFASFYAFAGQPSLRALPVVPALVSLALALLGARVLHRRLAKTVAPASRRVALPVVR